MLAPARRRREPDIRERSPAADAEDASSPGGLVVQAGHALRCAAARDVGVGAGCPAAGTTPARARCGCRRAAPPLRGFTTRAAARNNNLRCLIDELSRDGAPV